MKRLKGIDFTVTGTSLSEFTVKGVAVDGRLVIDGVVDFNEKSTGRFTHKFKGRIDGYEIDKAYGSSIIECINNTFCLHETELYYAEQ